MKNKFLSLIMLLTALIPLTLLTSCSDDDDDEATTGTIEGIVTDKSSSAALEGVLVSLFNSENNQSTGKSFTTGVDGSFTFVIEGGGYYLKFSKQSYEEVPAQGATAIGFTLVNGTTEEQSITLASNGLSNIGWISGQLSFGDDASGTALVIATTATEGYSTIPDSEGNYIIYNVPANNYTLTAWGQGLTATPVDITVTTDSETVNNIAISKTDGVTVSGSITFLASSAVETDVTLTHPITEEAIPGLSTLSSSNYSFSNVPDGLFLARATYRNDERVMDPDWIIKNGEPLITVAGSNIEQNFSLTGSIALISPTNSASLIEPIATTATPTFEWEGYSSTSDYVIEVSDVRGKVIWGGFGEINGLPTKNVIIPGSETNYIYPTDGSAPALIVGEVYKWKIYASKDDTKEDTGWKLISASEDQRGLIIIE